MKDNELIEKIKNSDVQIEKLFWLPGISLIADNLDDFTEIFDDYAPEDIRKIFGLNPEEHDYFFSDFEHKDDDDDDLDYFEYKNFMDWLSKRCKGFVAQLTIPVKENFGEDGKAINFRYWCVYQPVIYADTFEELIDKAIRKGQECETKDREKWWRAEINKVGK